jgi:hypothetical protein
MTPDFEGKIASIIVKIKEGIKPIKMNNKVAARVVTVLIFDPEVACFRFNR